MTRKAGLRELLVLMTAMITSGMLLSARAEEAIKHYILINLKPGADQLALDRWYMTYHAPQVRRAMKAWQRNYVSFRSYLPPQMALERYPLQFGRMTEIHFDSYESFQQTRVRNLYGELSSYTPPPGGWRGNTLYTTETATIPVNPTRMPVTLPTPPKETPYLRWIIVFDYPDGVTPEEGDHWWAEVREPALAKLPGLKRLAFYTSASARSPDRRVAELWFEDVAAWQTALLSGNKMPYAAPPWGEPFEAAAMMMIGENPDVDFIHDDRVIP
ncbi:hypothetical protein [Parvularcula marina]|uniref:hypothetical protein n=1 Tax=Parvularcula marina TaxID=2292771 RepID=UPI0035197414